MKWSKYPVIYEINTWVWLNELSRRHRRTISLANIPDHEWDALIPLGMDAVWLMGVWERSPVGRDLGIANPQLQEDFRRALPDVQSEDIVGSPYCIRRYVVDECLGGPEGLAKARENLAQRGIRLILDFVPNHVAPDHPWVSEHPEYFIQGKNEDLERDPASFIKIGDNIYARGRDPFFPAWPDVLQLNAFNPDLRRAIIETLTSIAKQADGVRCDMAMLLLNDIFQKTWGSRGGQTPTSDYWKTIIPAVTKNYRNFIFIAEAYWDLEWQLQQHGFDFCYDKRFYDRLCHDTPDDVRSHLMAEPAYQDGLVRFIENHDEPRAAAVFPPEKNRAMAVAMMTLQGAKLIHEGQIDGMKVRLPVFLARRPEEQPDPDLRNFYLKLLKALNREVFRTGHWSLCELAGWPENQSFHNLGAWCWTGANERYLIVVNLSEHTSQALVKIPWFELQNKECWLTDALSQEVYQRDVNDMLNAGLYVDLKGWAFHCFQLQVAHGRSGHAKNKAPSTDEENALVDEREFATV